MERDQFGYPALHTEHDEHRTIYRVWRSLAHILTVVHVRPTSTPASHSGRDA